jgi:regulator of protease activity HflC (stomatin/prohibitin superfamily)
MTFWIILLVILVIIVLALLLIQFFTVPEKSEYNISIFNKFWKTCKPGLNWRVRWFSNVDAEVFMGVQSMTLSLGEPGEKGGGSVNFEDQSASMNVSFSFQVVDSYLATYVTSNVMEMVAEQADDTIRSFLSLFRIEKVNSLKNDFDLRWIVVTKKPVSGEDPPELSESHLYKVLMGWGIKPLYFNISDIDMPEDVVAQIKRRQAAETDDEVAAVEIKIAKKKAKKALIDAAAGEEVEVFRATGVSKGMDKISEAMAQRIKDLIAIGNLSEKEAMNHVVSLAKMKALENSNQVIWAEGNSDVGKGASFGAGFSTANANNPASPKID